VAEGGRCRAEVEGEQSERRGREGARGGGGGGEEHALGGVHHLECQVEEKTLAWVVRINDAGELQRVHLRRVHAIPPLRRIRSIPEVEGEGCARFSRVAAEPLVGPVGVVIFSPVKVPCKIISEGSRRAASADWKLRTEV
jgi:hypothetical protein